MSDMHMFGILVDAHGLAYWWMHMVGILVDAHVGMLIKAYD
jgi:hypothetical protein